MATPAAAAADDPVAVLRRVFGFPGFRGLQEAAVRHVIAGGDALVLMPTGGGKSLCYQLPALCRPGTAVVVSPLIALMDDQVAALRQVGVRAGALHSELEPAEARATAAALADGSLDLLYVSPERLLGNGTLDRLAGRRLSLFAIDEAHCVSQWGHEFRPEYRGLAGLAERFPGVPRIALTATADPRTRADILHALAMDGAAVFAASFHRPNLHIAAAPKVSETAQLLAALGRDPGCAIVYCGSRAKTERTAEALRKRGLPALAFHAGLEPAAKRAALARFRSGEAMVMVATIAFGMGIDRPDVRHVVHLDMPDSPEAYYQQIGRAGRDGDPAATLLLYGGEDIARARHWLTQSTAPAQQQREMRTRLEAMISLTETAGCRTQALLACFGETLAAPCGHCDNCATPPVTRDGTTEAQKVLSAVYRTGQMFGALHVVAVLRGEATEGVQRHGHDRLPTFGVGADRPGTFWRGVIRQLIAEGALDVDTAGHGGLFLVPERARPILRGEARFALRETPVA
ncbi:RecQ family ATP-dependent DNA helicase, partial [Acidisphaera rubrifaciens]|uniref:RecQ family ATP-dependent DNA helicase n=1 Tax=Acidisphaera rubrifaciens TaxID=50715 RepID=UPI00069BF5B0